MRKSFALLFISFLLLNVSNAQDLRVEPGNWWTGFKETGLQLLVHGRDIGNSSPVISYPGVTIKKITKGESKNYLFIDLVVSPAAKAGTFPIRFMNDGKTTATYQYPLLARRKNAADLKGFDASDVIYLITPDRFANGDTKNDESPSMREKKLKRDHDYGRHGGDIRGMIDQLDYISRMGFTAIWPTPVLENDMPSSSYHGYAITDFYKVDPRMGTLDEYRELAEKARLKGIKLIFDGVVNHSGAHYWWMNDLPFKNWINYPDSIRITNHRRTVNQDLYAAGTDKDLMTRGWFVSQMPDLNHDNPFLATYMIQNSIWWIETLGLGGIRQDTYPYSGKGFLAKWTCAIMKEYPSFSIVGEEWTPNPLIAAYWQKGKPNTTGYNGCLRSPMDFPMQGILAPALTEEEGWDKGLIRIYEGLANDFAYANPKDLLVFGDNHDMDRLYTQLKKDPALLRMALTWLLTSRGIPQLYYGTEVLIDNSAKPGDHGLIRTDFPGGWAGDKVNGFTGAGLSEDQKSMQDFLRAILNWRKGNKVISEGQTLHFIPSNGMYVYFRYNNTGRVMVVMNKNSTAVKMETARYAEGIAGKKTGKNILTGEKIAIGDRIEIPPRSAYVLELVD